ncbi:MAG: cobalamin-binding protein [Elusimicrobia bacterium]|nr:MAG: cobalamin-binding protein [Elusimicrobiota bacterium]
MENQEFKRIVEAILVGDIEKTKALTQDILNKGVSPHDVIEKGLMEGMNLVGDKFENREYFLPDLLVAAEAVKRATEIIKPHLKGEKGRGTVVIGTVSGDIHDLGKNLVVSTLEASGFKVVDLGVDVPSEKFVNAVKEEKANIVAISALITTTMLGMKDIIEAMVKDGIRKEVKVMVGGAPLDEEFARKIGADRYARSSRDATRKAVELVNG